MALTADEKYMKEAKKQAMKAYALGEVPIGCVIVYEDKIIARGYNRRNTDKNTLSHAELNAIRKASRKLGDWRLEGCTMYVTLEPCPMCAGAIINARIRTVYYGAPDPKAGSCGTLVNLFALPYNHKPEVVSGVMEEECAGILRDFFRALRKRQKEARNQQKIDAGSIDE